MNNLESSFHADMVNIFNEAKEIGYKPTYFLRMVGEHGGYKAAKILIYKDEVTEGYIKLWELGRLDLSVEALVLHDKYRDLFTALEREICLSRLQNYNFDTSPIND